MSDHFVSEAVYLTDPDGHGIEIYHDRPREVWEGKVWSRMTTEPLDVASLLGELAEPGGAPFTGLPPGTDMGHVHLQVADLEESVGFYRDVLGFELMAELFGSAAFFGAGGYHHHVGANIWHSRGASPAPAGRAALGHATIVLPNADERDRVAAASRMRARSPRARPDGVLVRDPSGINLLLTTAFVSASCPGRRPRACSPAASSGEDDGGALDPRQATGMLEAASLEGAAARSPTATRRAPATPRALAAAHAGSATPRPRWGRSPSPPTRIRPAAFSETATGSCTRSVASTQPSTASPSEPNDLPPADE